MICDSPPQETIDQELSADGERERRLHDEAVAAQRQGPAPVKDHRRAQVGAADKPDHGRFFRQPGDQVAGRDVGLGHGQGHDADQADGDGDGRAKAQGIAQDQQPQDRHLHGLGLRVGGADGEVLEREQPDQQKREDDLRQPAQETIDQELSADGGHRVAAQFDQAPDVKHRERPGVEKPHVGRARRRQTRLQVLLQPRAQGLKESGGDGEGNPQFEHRRRL